jgi:hypothetical protein
VHGGAQPGTVDAQPLPVQKQVEQLGCGAAKYEGIGAEVDVCVQ